MYDPTAISNQVARDMFFSGALDTVNVKSLAKMFSSVARSAVFQAFIHSLLQRANFRFILRHRTLPTFGIPPSVIVFANESC